MNTDKVAQLLALLQEAGATVLPMGPLMPNPECDDPECTACNIARAETDNNERYTQAMGLGHLPDNPVAEREMFDRANTHIEYRAKTDPMWPKYCREMYTEQNINDLVRRESPAESLNALIALVVYARKLSTVKDVLSHQGIPFEVFEDPSAPLCPICQGHHRVRILNP